MEFVHTFCNANFFQQNKIINDKLFLFCLLWCKKIRRTYFCSFCTTFEPNIFFISLSGLRFLRSTDKTDFSWPCLFDECPWAFKSDVASGSPNILFTIRIEASTSSSYSRGKAILRKKIKLCWYRIKVEIMYSS